MAIVRRGDGLLSNPVNFFAIMETVSEKIRVLVADDQPMVRVGLRAMLALFPKLDLVGDASSGKEAVLQATRLHPDIVLLDVQMPDGPAFEACRSIVALNKGIRVIFLTSFADDDVVFEAISAGAAGFLLKDSSGDDVVHAINQVMTGGSVVAPSITHHLIMRIKRGAEKAPAAGFDALTFQEKRVLVLVSQGKTNKEIGAEMSLSPKTVNNYLSSLLDKLALKRRSQAAAFYARSVHDATNKALRE
ncbi:MAG TPA: response regulator transcription factor [Verrucomicrobiae bacterium]